MDTLSQFCTNLDKKLRETKNVMLIAHKGPDGDAIGSLEGLRGLLTDNYTHLKTSVCIPQEVSTTDEHLSWLLGPFIHEVLEDVDLIIILDCGTLQRTALSPESFTDRDILCIDHHEITPDTLPGYIDPKSASTTLILTHIARQLNWQISPTAATSLLTGIYTDTGGFIHRNTDAFVFEAASFLMSLGADQGAIAQEIFGNYRINYLHDLGRGLQSIVVSDRIACLYLEDVEDVNLKNHIISYLSGLRDVDIACVLVQNGNEVKGSLRTRKDTIDVNEIAKKFGGGGHKKAAGFVLPGRLSGGELDWNKEKYSAEDFVQLLVSTKEPSPSFQPSPHI